MLQCLCHKLFGNIFIKVFSLKSNFEIDFIMIFNKKNKHSQTYPTPGMFGGMFRSVSGSKHARVLFEPF